MQPAKVMVRGGKLTVEANNSDLPQILNQVAGISGIAIKGINGGPRVFGVYGPGDAREVLTALLAGSGYNFIMVGGSGDGPPREVLLTLRNKPASKVPDVVGNSDDDDPGADIQDFDPTDNATTPATPEAPAPPSITQMPETPGSITPVPEAPSKDDLDVQKTLERLKAIHDQEQQESQEPPQ